MAKAARTRRETKKRASTTTSSRPSGTNQPDIVDWLSRVGIRRTLGAGGYVIWVVERRPAALAEITRLRGELRKATTDRRRAWVMSMLAFLLAVVRGRTVEVERLVAAAAKLGSPAALYTVGVWLVERERFADGVRALKQALGKGRTEALVELGKLYACGRGVRRDRNNALALLKRSHRIDGSPQAAYWVGSVYDLLLPRRSRLAVSWYRKAAELGVSDAMFYLADMFERGDGVRRSRRQALEWYRSAAKAGDKRAHRAIDAVREQLRSGS